MSMIENAHQPHLPVRRSRRKRTLLLFAMMLLVASSAVFALDWLLQRSSRSVSGVGSTGNTAFGVRGPDLTKRYLANFEIDGPRMPRGTEAPSFTLPDVVNGTTVSLADFRGKSPVLLLFVCFSCSSFGRQLGQMTALHARHSEQAQFLFLFVSDGGHEPPRTGPLARYDRGLELSERHRLIGEIVEEMDLPFPCLFAEGDMLETAYKAWPERRVAAAKDGEVDR